MNTSHSLPVRMPNIENQRWSCHSCGNCCRELVVHLLGGEYEQIDGQGWAQKLGVAPSVRVGRGWVLNKRGDGACVFLDEHTRCRIHTAYGEDAKPFACRIFPFSVRPVRNGWQASLRFDCPSVISSKGRPIKQNRAWLQKLVRQLNHHPPRGDDRADMTHGLRATPDEIDIVLSRFGCWLKNHELSMSKRLLGAAHITTALENAQLKKVRGLRFAQLLDLLFAALPEECAIEPSPPTARQCGMLRQLAFAHAEHVTVAQMRSGLAKQCAKRWRQLRNAKRFRTGTGVSPALPGFTGNASFDAIESVTPAIDRTVEIDGLLFRYLAARFQGRSVFSDGYYGWPVFRGLAALWLSVAAAGWLARYAAAVDHRGTLTFEDVARALAVVDRAATRSPVLGTVAERARAAYLLKDDGIARLMYAWRLVNNP